MNISDCMKRNVISISANATVQMAAKTLISNHIGTLPIVDEEKRLIGLVRLRDLINLAMPDFVNLVDHIDFVTDFGAVENHKLDPDILFIPLTKIMKEPVSVDETSGLIRAAALFLDHQMSDLPVVDREAHLVGIASYVDIGLALMSNWDLTE